MSDRSPKPSSYSASIIGDFIRRIAIAIGIHRWFAACATACVLVFAGVLTNGDGGLFVEEQFADFYDYQAQSLLHGRLDVPREAIALEAFEYNGKTYGYFGPTPAFFRLPFVALHVGFGRLSRCFMLLYFGATLAAGYTLLLEAMRRFAPERGGAPPPWMVVLFTANAGIGNTMFFLASRAYIYHEAILCGAMFASWSVLCTLRYLDTTAHRWWIGALVCGTLSLHARPPTGLFALAVLGIAAGRAALRLHGASAGSGVNSKALWSPVGIVVLALLGIASFNGLSYLKFHTFEGCPLRLNVQYDAVRLERIGGRQFFLGNLPFSTSVYLLQPHADVNRYFPYVEMLRLDTTKFPHAKIDLAEPTLAFPYAMPGIFVAALLGSVVVFTRGPWAGREALAVLWLGAIPMGVAMFAAVAVSHRYTADFCPWLVATAAFGCASTALFKPRARALWLGILGTLTAFSTLLSLALTLHQQGEVIWGVPDATRANYSRLRERIDQFFGVRNPAGYDPLTLPIRQTDALTLIYKAKLLLQDPAKHAHAIRLSERAVELQPRSPLMHGFLGEALVHAGRVEGGIEHYRIAIQLDPTIAVLHHNLGMALLNLGRMTEAIQELVQALRHDPSRAEPRDVLEKLGVMKKAAP